MRSLSGYVLAAALAGSASGAYAADVFFEGTLNSICILGLTTQGGLVVDTQGRLSSVGAVGLGSVTVLTTGGNRLKIKKPAWVSTPGGYTQGGEDFEYSYTGLAGLGVPNVDWTSADTDVSLPVLPLSTLLVNARATAATGVGFSDGTYRMKVEVTCSAS